MKLNELESRLRDIDTNLKYGDDHIRKYKEELEMDVKKSEEILRTTSAQLAAFKATIEAAIK